jgi:hypothetical protein
VIDPALLPPPIFAIFAPLFGRSIRPRQRNLAMRIEQLKLGGDTARPALEWSSVSPGISAIYGPRLSGKTRLAEFLAHVLYGQLNASGQHAIDLSLDGEAIVESNGERFRLRRYHDGSSAARLTVAALDAAAVDHRTVRSLTYGLPPRVLGPLCAVDFREPPDLAHLLSEEFARGFQAIGGTRDTSPSSVRTAELTARRDLLAQELETRIAGERRASKELDVRWHELDRLVRQLQERVAASDDRRRAVEAALAETDARLRYRRLELNSGATWPGDSTATAGAQQLSELDSQIAHWRAVLADVSERLSALRTQVAAIRPENGILAAKAEDQRAWLSVARQLAADLAGEVSRLARASASEQCVCQDAHPRLRPIADTLQRQLDTLDSLMDRQRRALAVNEMQAEVHHLSRTEADVRRHLDHLLDRRQTLTSPGTAAERNLVSFTAADAEQLEHRRMELEQERFQLLEELREHKGKLRDLRAQRDTVERQRAALLSARSIEHVQRELADVQRKLEQAAVGATQSVDQVVAADNPYRASDFLAQITNGNLVRLELTGNGRRARVVDRTGEVRPVELLSAAERDQAYLSLCLALHAAAAQHGVWLPLVLDDPFVRLDGNGIASLAAVLDGFARQGHQVIVFTGQQAAAERMQSIAVKVRDIASLRISAPERETEVVAAPPAIETTTSHQIQKSARRTSAERVKRKATRATRSANGHSAKSDHSDAA